MKLWDPCLRQYSVCDSPIVAFESSPEDEHGCHTGIVLEQSKRERCDCDVVFPPNCLYRLREVRTGGFTAPGGVFVQQKLLVVACTYLPTARCREDLHVHEPAASDAQ